MKTHSMNRTPVHLISGAGQVRLYSQVSASCFKQCSQPMLHQNFHINKSGTRARPALTSSFCCSVVHVHSGQSQPHRVMSCAREDAMSSPPSIIFGGSLRVICGQLHGKAQPVVGFRADSETTGASALEAQQPGMVCSLEENELGLLFINSNSDAIPVHRE